MESKVKLVDFLKSKAISFDQGVELSDFTYFKSGGALELLVQPSDVEQLQLVISFMSSEGLPYKVIGETSNLMFLDETDYSCCISTRNLSRITYSKEKGLLMAESGAMLPHLARRALYEHIDGFAGLEGIPGTIGGAVFMNAGAYGSSIHQVIAAVDVLNPDGSLETLQADQLGLKYRNSIFKKGEHEGIILKAYFHARMGDAQEIYHRMELLHAKRHKYQEFMYPNLGSVYSGSIYRALADRDLYYRIVSAVYLFLNYKFKCFRRESPINRKWINDFTVKHFDIQFEKQPFSDKTMNSLVNNGHHTDDHLNYISQIEKLIGGSVPLENEVVRPF